MRIMVCLLCLGLVGGFGVSAVAQDARTQAAAPRFFEALYDVPVMPGLEELKEAAMLFDKPDGRIASVVAASKTLSPKAIEGFYAEALPQLGWRKTTLNQYVRDGNTLFLELGVKDGMTTAHFTLSPR